MLVLFAIISVNNNTDSKDSQDPAVPCGRLLHSGCVNRGRRTDLWPPGSRSPCILSWCRGSSDDTGDMCCPESARVMLLHHKQTCKGTTQQWCTAHIFFIKDLVFGAICDVLQLFFGDVLRHTDGLTRAPLPLLGPHVSETLLHLREKPNQRENNKQNFTETQDDKLGGRFTAGIFQLDFSIQGNIMHQKYNSYITKYTI